MEKLNTSNTFSKMAAKRMHILSSYPPGSASGYKLQKPSKESGIIQSLGTIYFVLFY